ncbi:MAG: CHAT domain-containing protein [Verrucomicrobiales bacterium]|nr:CHAT domain-containing protein [Verrucomicrobiales bacterium]
MLRILPVLLLFLTFSSIQAQEDLAERMENAIKMLEDAGQAEPQTIAMMLTSAAEGYIQKGDFKTALARAERALQLSREHDLDPMMAFMTASKILNKTDDEVATGFLIRELQAPGSSNQYKKGVLKALDIHLAINGDQKLALQAAFELWKITHADSPGTDEEFWALWKYGNHCLTGKLYDLAGPALKDARALALEMGKPDLAANASRSLGMALMSLGKYEDARKLYEETLTLARATPNNPMLRFELQNFATLLLQMGELDEAEKMLEETEALSSNDFEVGIVKDLQNAIQLRRALSEGGEVDLSGVIAMQKEVVAEKLKNTAAGEEFAYLGATADFIALASFQILAGDLDGAEESLADAARGADAWEENSRKAQKSAVFSADQVNLSMADIRAGIFEFQQQIDVARGNLEAALVTAENGRGTAQAELLRERLGLEPSDRVVKELDARAIAKIAANHRTTFVVYSLAHSFAPMTRGHFSQSDPRQHPQFLYVWVVSPEGKYTFRSIPLKGSITELVQLARQEIMSKPEEKPKGEPLSILSELLIGSIREDLPTEEGASVTIVPQGQLFLVPFAALKLEGETTMIDRFTIGMSPSIELMELAAERRKAVEVAGNKEILIVGNPTMPGYQSRPDRDAHALSPLPGAEAEAKYLGQALKTVPMIGDDATETAIVERMESARFLHFATHGLLETESGYNQSFLSALAFAPSPGEDGFLTAKETARMNLRAELAVLSACDTGRGQISGDGVIGLTRGYITAGVPTVVVSLWPVNDQATAILMGNYYQAMMRGEGKASALRAAILETKKKFPNPQLWAPFVLYGLAQ